MKRVIKIKRLSLKIKIENKTSAQVSCAFSLVPAKHPSLFQNPCRIFPFIVDKPCSNYSLHLFPSPKFYGCFASPPAVSLGTRSKTIIGNQGIGTEQSHFLYSLFGLPQKMRFVSRAPTKKFEVNGEQFHFSISHVSKLHREKWD
jgi:hypothetical protein